MVSSPLLTAQLKPIHSRSPAVTCHIELALYTIITSALTAKSNVLMDIATQDRPQQQTVALATEMSALGRSLSVPCHMATVWP